MTCRWFEYQVIGGCYANEVVILYFNRYIVVEDHDLVYCFYKYKLIN